MPTGFNEKFNDIWGSDDSNVYVVGDNGLMLNFDGNKWNEVAPYTLDNLVQIFGRSKNEIYLISLENELSEGGTIFYYDGTTWDVIDTFGLGYYTHRLYRKYRLRMNIFCF